MVDVKDNDIRMTRGDTAILNLSIQNADGTPYEITSDDTILLTVKKNKTAKAIIIQKAVADNRITITPKETESLEYGPYCYDVELRRTDGFVATIISPHTLTLCEEVTF